MSNESESVDIEMSRLEAGFGAQKIGRRPISLEIQEASRHATAADLTESDLDIEFDVDIDTLQAHACSSLQAIYPAMQYSSHMANAKNFADRTEIECFELTNEKAELTKMDAKALEIFLKTIEVEEHVPISHKAHGDVGNPPSSARKVSLGLLAESEDSTSQLPHTSVGPVASLLRPSNSNRSEGNPLAVNSIAPLPWQSASWTRFVPKKLSSSSVSKMPSEGTQLLASSTSAPSSEGVKETPANTTTSAMSSQDVPAESTPSRTAASSSNNPNIDISNFLDVALSPKSDSSGRLVIFFALLRPAKDTSFGSQVQMQRSSVHALFNAVGANTEFLLNLLGRPDYWSPKTRWQYDSQDKVTICGMHPRWNVQLQGAPLSVYVLCRMQTKLTVYIISHKVGDSSVRALQNILRVGLKALNVKANPRSYLCNPFEIAVLLSSLSFEVSKHHVAKYRRYMWAQVNKVDDHLAGLETNDRGRLTALTKALQVISQQADSHLLNANVAILTARGVSEVQSQLHDHLRTPKALRQPAEDVIKYVIDSFEKQKMLFLNYKSRKDGTMSLVYNLVTQSDAANNIQLAESMKHDSTSMSAIAALTMLFLPGTFTSSILSAGIFSASQTSAGIATSRMWWLWTAITVPLTLIVLGAWWIYRRISERPDTDASDGSSQLARGRRLKRLISQWMPRNGKVL